MDAAGRQAFAELLGFESPRNTANWAYDHPALWGNGHGAGIFDSPLAYGDTAYIAKPGSVSLRRVTAWWKQTADRVRRQAT